MIEPAFNIGIVSEGVRAPDPRFVEQSLDFFAGKHVKLSFPTKCGKCEYMWVLVTSIAENNDEELRGILDNIPRCEMDITCGDIVEFSRSEVIEVLEN